MSKTFFSVTGPVEATVGANAVYEVGTSGEDGNAKDVDISRFKGWLRGLCDFEATINHGGWGQYQFVVRPTQPGTYYLDVTFGEQPVFSPTDMETVVTGKSQLSQPKICFEFTGQGIHNGRVGETASFILHSATASRAPIDLDEPRISVMVSGPSQASAAIRRQAVGQYVVSYRVVVPGTYTVHVSYDGHKVIDSPVSFSGASSARNSSLTVSLPARVRANTTVRFTIQSKDPNGIPITSGGDDWQALATGPERVTHLTIMDNVNGTYSGEVIFPGRGNYSVKVLLFGEEIPGSPMKVTAE